MKVRIQFQKKGIGKFVGHLDLMRYFQKVIRRADIPVRYSEGFSPHQKISFANPLALGILSEAEYLDMELTEDRKPEEIMEKMNRVSVPEFPIVGAYPLPDDAKNAMSIVSGSDYRIFYRGNEPEDFNRRFLDFYGREEVKVIKKTKKSEREINLKERIREISLIDGAIFLSLDTGSASNVSPEFLLEIFSENEKREYRPADFEITRTELYGIQDGTEKPLWAFGNSAEKS